MTAIGTPSTGCRRWNRSTAPIRPPSPIAGGRLRPGQAAVGDAVRTSGLDAEPLDLVGLVGVVVALEPEPLGGVLVVALPGEDVGRDAVEEPPVVGGDHGAAREVEERVLQGLQGLDVEVVGGLVEQQQVAAHLQREREVETVALTTGEDAGLLLLV